MAFVERKIDLTFELGEGAFGESGANKVTVSGLRVQAHIVKAGGASMGELQLRVFGLPLAIMNQLTALTPQVMMQRNNKITVTAGDAGSQLATVFIGTIAQGWLDLNSPPNAVLHIIAFSGYFEKLKPIAPSSYPAGASVVTIMESLAKKMGLNFENNGISNTLSTPYFPGTAWDQARACADAANINWTVDNGILAIWPKGGSRTSLGLVPIISRDTGMIGYPAYNGTGIEVTTVFNPGLVFGQTAEVHSIIKNAEAKWFVCGLTHDLESELPGGEWFSHFQGAPLYNNVVMPTLK